MKKIMGSLFLLFCINSYAKETNPLVGVWKYVRSASADGTIDTSLGEHPLGYLIYTPEGIMSVQIMRPNRAIFKSDQPTAQESQNIPADFFAYSGHYTIDTKQHIVTHQLEMAVLPSMVGKNYQRYYQIKGNLLYLTVVDSKKGQTLTWERVV